MMGVSPEQAVKALTAWGADAVGGNCGNGPDELLAVVERMHAAAPEVVLVACGTTPTHLAAMARLTTRDAANGAPGSAA